MKYLALLIILTRCLLIQGVLEWIVHEKIPGYGHNLTLFCNVPNCCPKLPGWDKYIPAQQTIVIDLKTWTSTKKYDGKVLKDGYTLIIQNLTKEDLNVSYACVYGSTLGDKQSLLEENVFNYISTTQHNGPIDNNTFTADYNGTTQQDGPIDNETFSAGKIAGIIVGVSVAVYVALLITYFWKCRKEMDGIKTSSFEDYGKLNMKRYYDAIESGSEIRQYVRIQVIGKYRVGKTSLVRRLLFLEDGAYDGKSTDGIEIDRKCQIRRNDGKWFVGEDEAHTKDLIRRIQLAVKKKEFEEYVLGTGSLKNILTPTLSKTNNMEIKTRNL